MNKLTFELVVSLIYFAIMIAIWKIVGFEIAVFCALAFIMKELTFKDQK